MDKVKLTVTENGKTETFSVSRGALLSDALRECKKNVYSPCGGRGVCGKCRVKATGLLSKPDENELAFIGKDESTRLCCRAKILGDATVELESAEMSVETRSEIMANYEFSPLVSARESGDGYDFIFDGNVISHDETNENYGIAVDIGTTTVAVYLCDMNARDNSVIGVTSFANPQGIFGGDVISRIDKIISDKDNLLSEQRAVTNAINSATTELCTKLHKSIKFVRACVICGNTVMQHIAAGIDPTPISYAPFTSPTLFERAYFKAAKIGLSLGNGAICMFAPCFASYVGGDIAAGLVSTGLCNASDTSLFLDIGTNGETALVCRGKIYLCSAAAGPAFEGAGIECGTAGISGAISSVSYDGKIKFETLDGKAPVGICGSGIIDAISVMLDAGVLDESGATIGDKFNICENVYISGKDVRKIQLAKAAVCAGILTLMKEANVGTSDIDRVILAGGFGSHINAENAAKIGLIPKGLAKKAIFAGNTAGSGAVAMLCSKEARLAAEKAIENSIYTELSESAYFTEEYIEQMSFE